MRKRILKDALELLYFIYFTPQNLKLIISDLQKCVYKEHTMFISVINLQIDSFYGLVFVTMIWVNQGTI